MAVSSDSPIAANSNGVNTVVETWVAGREREVEGKGEEEERGSKREGVMEEKGR